MSSHHTAIRGSVSCESCAEHPTPIMSAPSPPPRLPDEPCLAFEPELLEPVLAAPEPQPQPPQGDAAAAAAPAASSSSSSSASSSAAPAPASAASSSATFSTGGSKVLEARSVSLSRDQIVYLNLMAERYKLGSLDKAARCLVNYADKDGDKKLIFSQYRCRHCGIKFPKTAVSIQLYPHQWSFLDRMKAEHQINDPNNDGKPFRCLLDFTQEGAYKRGMNDAERAHILQTLETDIFEKVRCNDPVCTHKH